MRAIKTHRLDETVRGRGKIYDEKNQYVGEADYDIHIYTEVLDDGRGGEVDGLKSPVPHIDCSGLPMWPKKFLLVMEDGRHYWFLNDTQGPKHMDGPKAP